MCSHYGKVCYGKNIKITDNSLIITLCNSYHEALSEPLTPLGDSIEPFLDSIEHLSDSIEPFLDSIEHLLDSIEPVLDSIEPF